MKYLKTIIAFAITIFFFSCKPNPESISVKEYHASTDTGIQAGGIKMIPIKTQNPLSIKMSFKAAFK